MVSHICIELLTPNGGGSIARSPHLGGIYAVKRVSMTPAGYFFAIELLYAAPALPAVVRKTSRFVKKVRTVAFDPKIFLAKVGDGKAISKYQKDQIVFSQGDPADAVFYIQTGRIKLTVVSERGKEAVVGILEPRHFLAKGALTVTRCGSQRPRRSVNP